MFLSWISLVSSTVACEVSFTSVSSSGDNWAPERLESLPIFRRHSRLYRQQTAFPDTKVGHNNRKKIFGVRSGICPSFTNSPPITIHLDLHQDRRKEPLILYYCYRILRPTYIIITITTSYLCIHCFHCIKRL